MKPKLTFLPIIIILICTACTPSTPQATQTPTPLPIETVTPIPTATSTPQPSPTPDRFSAEALAFIPHTIDEIGQSVEVRSPIDDPEGYKEDITKVLVVIHEQILPEYDGDKLKAGAGQLGELYDSHVISFNNIQLIPIASVYFDWADKDRKIFKVPLLFFPAKDNIGDFTYSIILDPVRDFINTMGFVDNPAPDWHMSEIIKKFPMDIITDGSFETFYSLHPRGDDEFATDYFQASELIINGAGNELGGAYWNLLADDGIFNRGCELLSVVTRGGQ